MEVAIDYYKELDIDRTLDCKGIRKYLNQLDSLWNKRLSTTQDPESRSLILDVRKTITEAFKTLVKEDKRKDYDKDLQKAYDQNMFQDEEEEQLQTVLDKAREYYRKGELLLAQENPLEAVENSINDPEAYEILARCYYETDHYPESLEAIDLGLSLYEEDLPLLWLSARVASNYGQDFDDAQRRVNALLESAPDMSIGHSEQVFLHLKKGDETLAIQEIDSYLDKNPEDMDFRRESAYNLNDYTNVYYMKDPETGGRFLADKNAVNSVININSKANQVYDDDNTRQELDNARFYNQREWNSWNVNSIISLLLYGTLFMFFFQPLGIIVYAIAALLVFFSFRPVWQINKTIVTGQTGRLETAVNGLGNVTAWSSKYFVKAVIFCTIGIFRFTLWLISPKK